MKAIIQYNFSAGIGDMVTHQFELINTTKNLINLGYVVDLKLNIKHNSYFEDNMFFNFFNEDVYKIFNNVEILENPILNNDFEGFTKYYTFNNVDSGLHCWDLFFDYIHNDLNSDIILHYPYNISNPPEMIDIFNPKIIKEYKELKLKYNLNDDYDTIHFRTYDMSDNIEYFETKKSEIDYIIENSDKIFCCSNSYNFKSYVKNFKNVIVLPIIKEELYGAHFDRSHSLFYDMDIVHERTKFTIFEMLMMSESNKIYTFNILKRASNFLFISLVNKVKIKHDYI